MQSALTKPRLDSLSQRRARRGGVIAFGLLSSIAVHALLLAPILIGGRTHQQRKPDEFGTASSATPGSDGAMVVELIQETSAGREIADPPASQAPSFVPDPKVLARDLAQSLSLPAIEDEADSRLNAAQSAGDGAEYAMLFGRYIRQVSARIERAWMRPRTPIGADMFSCRVKVEQDHTGQVQRVTLVRCNGDERWRSSLVSAIRTASPLSAPPDPRVFTRVVALDFTSQGYIPGGSDEGYEPDALASATVSGPPVPVSAPAADTSDVAARLHALQITTTPGRQNP